MATYPSEQLQARIQDLLDCSLMAWAAGRLIGFAKHPCVAVDVQLGYPPARISDPMPEPVNLIIEWGLHPNRSGDYGTLREQLLEETGMTTDEFGDFEYSSALAQIEVWVVGLASADDDIWIADVIGFFIHKELKQGPPAAA